jgi:hypothetical protein
VRRINWGFILPWILYLALLGAFCYVAVYQFHQFKVRITASMRGIK